MSRASSAVPFRTAVPGVPGPVVRNGTASTDDADGRAALTLEHVVTQADDAREDGHPRWSIARDARARLRLRGSRKWFFGSLWGVAYLAVPIASIWTSAHTPTLIAVLSTALITAVGVAYVVIPPLLWGRPWPVAAAVFASFVALTCLGFPLIGINTVWLWIYVPIMAAMSWLPAAFIIGTIAVVVVAQLIVTAATGTFLGNWYAAALTASISIMMFAFGQQIRAVVRLRDAQSEIARLAVVDERERFARDMHDVLGHSLTVVTVKSELARRVMAQDPQRAQAELVDIERLSRSALADLRASVAGYRAMSLDTELAAAHAALVAAGVKPHLPASGDAVEPELREVFAWVLREAVTNVVRHARAKNCWVALERRAVIVGDDGRGTATTAGPAGGDGHGLAGMRERAAQVGGEVTVEPGEDGGTVVAVRVPSGASSRTARRTGGAQ